LRRDQDDAETPDILTTIETHLRGTPLKNNATYVCFIFKKFELI
jgi:hypothetical protein